MTASPYQPLIADAAALGLSAAQLARLRAADTHYAEAAGRGRGDGAIARQAWQSAAADAAAIVADSPPAAADIEAIVDRRLSERLKDAKLAEIEITQAVAERLIGWAKTFALVTAVPLALGGVLLAAVGISDWASLTKRIGDYRAEIDTRIAVAARTNDAVTARAQALNAKLASVEAATRTFDAKKALLDRDLASVERAAAASQQISAKVEELSKRVNAVEAEQLHFKGFSPSSEKRVKDILNGYRNYLIELGLTIPPSSMDVLVGGKDELNAYYDGKNLTFGATTAEMPDIVDHEYTHRILNNLQPASWNFASYQINGLHEGIASYLSASYLGRPVVGAALSKLIAVKMPDTDVAKRGYVAKLDENDRFDAPNIKDNDFLVRTIWAQALWDLRGIVGCSPTVAKCPAADRLVIDAWRRMTISGGSWVRMGRILVALTEKSRGADDAAKLRAAFARRGLAI